MYFPRTLLLALTAATGISAHGVVTEVKGANGVSMPGLTIQDGTPRDCSSKYVYPLPLKQLKKKMANMETVDAAPKLTQLSSATAKSQAARQVP